MRALEGERFLTKMKPADLLKKIQTNVELLRLELKGFRRGEKQGKTMKTDIKTLVASIDKQHHDLRSAYLDYVMNKRLSNLRIIKRHIADLRNAAGCLFLKILEKEEELTAETLEGANQQ